MTQSENLVWSLEPVWMCWTQHAPLIPSWRAERKTLGLPGRPVHPSRWTAGQWVTLSERNWLAFLRMTPEMASGFHECKLAGPDACAHPYMHMEKQHKDGVLRLMPQSRIVGQRVKVILHCFIHKTKLLSKNILLIYTPHIKYMNVNFLLHCLES